MKTKFKLTVLIVLTGVSSLVLVSGCKSTANGAGRDIEKMGEKIQEKTH